jgi:hypothetical protein
MATTKSAKRIVGPIRWALSTRTTSQAPPGLQLTTDSWLGSKIAEATNTTAIAKKIASANHRKMRAASVLVDLLASSAIVLFK